MLILGHRGFVARDVPENTLASVERALRAGADGVEVDLRLTADGVPVLHHDAHFRRTAGDSRHLSGLRLSELPRIGHARVPTLNDLLDLTGRRGRLVLELKSAPGQGHGAQLAAAVGEVVRRRLPENVVISSFDRRLMTAVREAALPVRTALLGRPGLPLSVVLGRAVRDGHDEVHPHVTSVLPRLELLSRPGAAVVPWTVDRPQDLGRLQDAGAFAVISDDPESARILLDARRVLRAG